jgi:hypothetical protein
MGDKQALSELPESTRKIIEEMNASFKPRRKERIPEILKALGELWELESDQRLGQLLENYGFLNGEHGDETSRALFYQEDDVTLANLKKVIERMKG